MTFNQLPFYYRDIINALPQASKGFKKIEISELASIFEISDEIIKETIIKYQKYLRRRGLKLRLEGEMVINDGFNQ